MNYTPCSYYYSKTMTSIKTQTNQRIIIEEYLKSLYEKIDGITLLIFYDNFKQKYELETLNNSQKNSLINSLSNILKLIEGIYHNNYFQKKQSRLCYNPPDYGKDFFDYAKKKAEEFGMPKSTFKTIKETRIIATELLQEWFITQFGKIEDLIPTETIIDWFDRQNDTNDIMLK